MISHRENLEQTGVKMHETYVRPFFYGFFGAPNFGDELLCRTVVELFAGDRDARVATRRPRITRHTLVGSRAKAVRGKFPHVDFWQGFFGRIWHLSRTSDLVIGGGGLIQDVYSTVGMKGISFDVAQMIRRGRPYVFVGIEIGTISQPVSKELSRFLVSNARAVWCRDALSEQRARALGATGEVILAPDLAHWLLRRWAASHATEPTSHCVVNPRIVPQQNRAEFGKMILALCQRYDRVTLAAAQPGEQRDWIAHLSPMPENLAVHATANWQETLELLASASTVIAERFHYIAAGAHLGRLVVPLLATHKAADLAEELAIPEHQRVALEDFDADAVMSAVHSAEPVPTQVLDRLASEVEGAADAVVALGGRRVTYPRASKLQARSLERKVLYEGLLWLGGGLVRRARRAVSRLRQG